MNKKTLKFQTVKFRYFKKGNCFKKTRWGGCCCDCKYHGMVYKHCSYSPRKDGCVCSEPLGFYVCTLSLALWSGAGDPVHGKVSLSGEHGFCEMHDNRK